MASPIVFKLRVIAPRSRDAPIRNRAHLFYIGKRIGVDLNSGMTHGLFGKTSGNDFGEIQDIKETADYIQKKTSEGTIMYRAVISLAEADAIRLGYNNRKAWEDMIQQNIFEMAEKIGIPPSRLEYTCAVHMDKGHPHMHLMFWDKEQGVKQAFVHSSVSNKIRIDLTKKIFKDELSELYQVKNEARNVLLGNSGDFFKSFFEPYQNMTEKEYKKAMEELRKNPDNALGYLLNTRIPPFALEDFALKIFEFKEKLPKTGRLNYKFLPPELKAELEEIISELVFSNEDFSREFEAYTNTSVELASYYTKSPDKLEQARQKAEDELIKRLSNKLLDSIKKIDQKQYEQNNTKAFRKTEAIRILADLFLFLTRSNESHRSRADAQKGELSRQAKKELAIKMEHAGGIDWERD